MNVLHVTPYYAPAWAYGGVPGVVAELAHAQAGLGHGVTVLTTDALAPHERLPQGEVVIDGVRVIRVPNISGATRTWLNLSTPAGLRARARGIFATQRIDVVHLHELRTVENLLVASVLPLPIAVVVSPHGTLRHDRGRSWARRGFDATIGDRLLARADQLIARSNVEAGEVRDLYERRGVGLPGGLISVVPNGVDLSAFGDLPSREEARRRFGLGGGPVVLFFGRLSERSGVRFLIAAFARMARELPGAQLLIAGPDRGVLSQARAQAAELGLEAMIRFPGYLTGRDALAAFGAADLFALPAVGEDLPLAALEALASGLPVLLSPDCNLQEAAAGGAGQTLPLDEAAWAAALLALLRDVPARVAVRERAKQVASQFTWPSIAAATLDVYERARRGRTA